MPALRQPVWLTLEEVPPLPPGWKALPTADACIQLKPGKLFDSKTVSPVGRVPVLNQSESGALGFHDESPGVDASPSAPVVTFANHTCAVRLMKEPFSVIQNIFPKVGRPGVTDTVYFYYASLGRVSLTDYKGHHPTFRQAYIPIPPLPIQRRIAGILSAYDDLIENSQRRIKILESMARALYREWFVHFRFPGHENHPRVASPLGEIPEGWEVRRIDEALRFDSGRTIKKEERENGNTPVYGANGIIGGTANAAMADKGIIMGKIGSCGALHRSHVPCWVTNNAFLVQPAAIQSWELAWQALLDIDFRQYVGGAANPYMPINTFGQHEVLVPTAGVQAEFQKRAAPLRILVETLSERIDNLRRTRDLLLPRLLSGQIALDALEAA